MTHFWSQLSNGFQSICQINFLCNFFRRMKNLGILNQRQVFRIFVNVFLRRSLMWWKSVNQRLISSYIIIRNKICNTLLISFTIIMLTIWTYVWRFWLKSGDSILFWSASCSDWAVTIILRGSSVTFLITIRLFINMVHVVLLLLKYTSSSGY